MRNRRMIVTMAVFAMVVAGCGATASEETTGSADTTAATDAPAEATTTSASPETTAGEEMAPETTSADAAPDEMMPLKIGLFPSLDYAAFYVGLEEGIFEDHGLDVEVEHIFTGTGLFSAITSGAVDLATNSLTSGSVGISNALPIKAVAVAAHQPTEGNTEVLVPSDSPIETWADLEGTTVATINLQGLFHLGVINAVASEGGDPASVEAVPMSPADEPPALAAGRLDAIVLQDPFLATAMAENDFRSLGNPFSTFDFTLPVGVFWSSIETTETKPELLSRFRDALDESTDYANANPERLLDVIPGYTDLEQDQLSDITLPMYNTELGEEPLLNMLQLMLDNQWMTYIPSYTQIVWTPEG
jgi:NitT/TauT family transport system substrate-binding protein